MRCASENLSPEQFDTVVEPLQVVKNNGAKRAPTPRTSGAPTSRITPRLGSGTPSRCATRFSSPREGSPFRQKVEETRVALREIGLNDEVEGE